MVLATAELILARYDTAFLLTCERVDEQHINVQHTYINKSSSWSNEELVAEKHNYIKMSERKKKNLNASNYENM